MKKVKRQDRTLFVLVLGVAFMVIVTVVMSFAYFTASAESGTQTIQFGVLELEPLTGQNSFTITSDNHIPIVPGCTIAMGGVIKLTQTSTVDAFVRMKPTVKVTKNGEEVTEVSANTFIELFNSALSNSANGQWKTPTTADGYLYFAGKFSNSKIGTNIVSLYDLSSASFELDATKFGNVWQGVEVLISLTVQALQSAHVGVDDVSGEAQTLVDQIAKMEAWKTEFNSGEVVVEDPALVAKEIESMSKLTFTVDADETAKTVSVKGIDKTTTIGDIAIPAYVKKNTDGTYERTNEAHKNDDNVFCVTSIDKSAFYNFSNLTSVIIPNSVTEIKYSAFSTCGGLKEITIPSSAISIGSNAFNKCRNLETIKVDKNNTMYDSREDCNAIIETETNTLIIGCKNTDIKDDVVCIGSGAFENCDGLTNITIPESVTSIGSSAFAGCDGLTNITIPESVTNIGDDSFRECRGLEKIEVEAGNTKYDSRNDCNAIIEKSTNKLIFGCKNTVIPSDVTSIGAGAFYYCSGLTNITIPSGVRNIGSSAFFSCGNLTSVTLPSGLINIESAAFSNCILLNNITIPNSVKNIGDAVFFDCAQLISINIPKSVDWLGENVFAMCYKLESISYGGSKQQWEDLAKNAGISSSVIIYYIG